MDKWRSQTERYHRESKRDYILDTKTNWVDELPNVLWGHRTTPRTTTGETSLIMVYGTEAVLPVEISIGSQKIEGFSLETSEVGLRLNAYLVEELRDQAHMKLVKYQQKVIKYYNSKVKIRQFQINDWVLWEVATSIPAILKKPSSSWEGPYKISKIISPETYRLSHPNGSPVQNTWNASGNHEISKKFKKSRRHPVLKN